MNTSFNVLSLNIFSLRQAYLARAVTVSEVIDEVLVRTRTYEEYNIWISLNDPEALIAEASRLDRQDPRHLPLYGIPFAIKDNIDFVGLPTTAACPAYSYLPTQTAFAVQWLIDAGAVLIGKTNMDQFATGLTGTRSPEPYGICKNALNPDYISGGSSSGSAVAVALNIVSFSLGTDTAGSGRVPAAFNNIVGLKPTRGLIGCSGVVPACKSLDCISIFSHTADEAEYLLDILIAEDRDDVYARSARILSEPIQGSGTKARFRFGVPKPEQLNFFGDTEGSALFQQVVANLQVLGEVVEIDFQPFLDAASLLYDGPWIAERYAGIREFIETHPETLHPVIRQVLSSAKGKNAIDTFENQHCLQSLKHKILPVLQGLSCIAVPSAPRIYLIEDVLADPVNLNFNLGYYTNYMNLLDLCAVAIPSEFYHQGLPFGITLFSSALSDRRLLDIARQYQALKSCEQEPNGLKSNSPKPSIMAGTRYQRIAVCGAHMHGLPLNKQLLQQGARFYSTARTSANYRLYALATEPPERPGLLRDEAQGQSIDLELWELPKENWAAFISTIKSPLCIGSVELEDGRWEYGFLCENYLIPSSSEITGHSGWRNYLNTQ